MTASMPKVNYQMKMEQCLADLPKERVPVLFLHACCAPCSSFVLETLSRYFMIRLFFYNPNIFPEDEYFYRLSEVKRLISELQLINPVEVINGEYVPKHFTELAKGLENEPERGERCRRCIALRLDKTVQQAVLFGADFVTTTLSISPHKDASFINEKGAELCKKYGASWLYSDFKKKGGYLRSIALSKEYNLYRQDFCGCVYSKAARDREREENQSSLNNPH